MRGRQITNETLCVTAFFAHRSWTLSISGISVKRDGRLSPTRETRSIVILISPNSAWEGSLTRSVSSSRVTLVQQFSLEELKLLTREVEFTK